MIPALVVIGYLLGVALGFVVSEFVLGWSTAGMILVGMAVGGVVASAVAVGYWFLVPPAARNIIRASKTGILIVAVGQDKKLRLLPGVSDGFTIRPVDKPYSQKYVWAADGESAYPVHKGRGMQAIVAYMGYPFPLDVKYAGAISRFREQGFSSIEDLKTAVELPSVEEVEERIGQVERLLGEVESLSEKEVEERFGAGKDDVVRGLRAELERLRQVRELVKRYGGGASLTVNVDGATVRARDLISYLVWKHHPAEIERIIKAETNAILARLTGWDLLKQWAPIILLGAMAVIAVLAALKFLAGPPEVNVIVSNITSNVSNATQGANLPIIGGGG